MVERTDASLGTCSLDDDGCFEELTRAVFQGGASGPAVDAKWPGFRRAFSNFSVRDVADYLPEDVDRLMSDPEIVRNLDKIEATIENAAEMLLIGLEHGSFASYLESFPTPADASADVTRRFQHLDPAAAQAFLDCLRG